MWVVSDLDDVERRLDGAAYVTLIFDVDNTLAPQGAPPDQFGGLVNDAIDRFESHRAVSRVIALTNGPQRDVTRMISRGNKPWTTRRRLGLDRAKCVCVVGDQVMTDGVLAWRLGATFMQLVIADEGEAPRQALMRRLGRSLSSLLFRREPG